tara:strand:- start:1394 stop:2350 length:957 start_codon:yes stop_codon:yes gene_type:complete
MKALTIHHDFNLGLKLYKIPKIFSELIYKKFPNLILKDINLETDYHNVEIYFGNRIDNSSISKYINLKWIHLGCVGYDSIDIKELISREIIMTNSSGLLTNSMVEHLISVITNFSRGTHYIYQLRNKNSLDRKNFDLHFDNITNLKNQKILICGYGEVGSKLSKFLELMGMEIYTISRSKKSPYKNFKLDNLKSIISEVKYIVNLLPLNNETKYIFNDKIFQKMDKAYFINVGRGKTVDEAALIEAIDKKNIIAAALDVFESEPLNNNSMLLKNQNIYITPHIAGLDSNYWNRQLDLFTHNLKYYILNEYLSLKNKIT